MLNVSRALVIDTRGAHAQVEYIFLLILNCYYTQKQTYELTNEIEYWVRKQQPPLTAESASARLRRSIRHCAGRLFHDYAEHHHRGATLDPAPNLRTRASGIRTRATRHLLLFAISLSACVWICVHVCLCIFCIVDVARGHVYARDVLCLFRRPCTLSSVLHANEYQQCQCYPSLRVPDFPLSQMVPSTSRLLLLLNLMCVLLLLYRYQWGVSHPYFYWVYENRLDEISANWVRTLFFLRTKFIV